MNEDEQRIAIVQWCGWTNLDVLPGKSGKHPCGYVAALPDYLNDLNAMHEAEERLSDAKKYETNLFWICDHDWQHKSPKTPRNPIYATAAQRAEALLKTIGKWKE